MLRAALRVVPIFLALAALSCAGMSAKKQEAQAHYKVGVSHLMKGENQAAFLKFQEALELDPRNEEIYNALGNVYLRLEDLDNAEKHFHKAVSIDGKYSEAYNNLCYVYYLKEQYEESIKTCRKALENPLYPTPDKAYYNIGLSHYRLGRYQEAIEAFDNAVKRFPNFFQAYYALALAYNATNEYGKAAEAMGYGVTFDPRFQGDMVKAEREFLNQQAGGEGGKELKEYLEILHY